MKIRFTYFRSPDATCLGIEGRSELAEFPSFFAACTEKGGILHSILLTYFS